MYRVISNGLRSFATYESSLLMCLRYEGSSILTNRRPSSLVFEGTRSISTSLVVRDFKIYTKTGDKGTSALFTGERRTKDDNVFNALGTIDELTSHIAMAREHAIDGGHSYADKLHRIQCILQDVASLVATPKSSAREVHMKQIKFSTQHVTDLEECIDDLTKELPPLQNFIIPGGGKASSTLHIARSVCRRAERHVAPLVSSGETDPEAIRYLNRLSDFLFTAARYATLCDKRQEEIYIRGRGDSAIKENVDSKKQSKSAKNKRSS